MELSKVLTLGAAEETSVSLQAEQHKALSTHNHSIR